MSCQCTRPENPEESILQRTDRIIDRTGRGKETVIPLLQALQIEFGYLPAEAVERIYERTEISRAQLVSVSTFYSQFRHIPLGKYLIKVCTGTACHVKGASNVYDAFLRQLGIEEGGSTTADRLFSVEKIACLGCCTLAPVVQVDDRIYGHVIPGRVDEVIAGFLEMQENRKKEDDTVRTGGQPDGEVRLGMGSCCMASGSADIYRELKAASARLGLNLRIKPVGCVGVCNKVPLIDVVDASGNISRYPNVKAVEIKEILHHHFKPSGFLKRLGNALWNHADTFHTDLTWDNVVWKPEQERTGLISSFLSSQQHISTEGYGLLTPLNIDEYTAHGGFEALKKALSSTPAEVVETVKKSGLRGRGGGGFPTGQKWSIAASATGEHKYMICNGDEGDPGAFMDRMILESYPFRVIEGMLIAAYATGAGKGIFYIRAEYPLAVTRIKTALDLCREKGWTGTGIAGSSFSFDISVFEGAGAFVCGEETALIASIEGDRGFPRQRPPYPAIRGLHGMPTLVNNVETLSQVPYIVKHGAEHYAATGTENSKGTKVFALAGKIRHGGLIEVPMGITLRQIIDNIGGGVEKEQQLKAVQIGGPSGGCIPAELCDMPVDFDAFTRLGAMMGSGGLVVLGEQDCMVDMARYFLSFTCDQSCGKCTSCRVGTRRMLDLLNKICSGKAVPADISLLEELALHIKRSALCALGKTAPNPVLTTLKYFRHEYEEHVSGLCRTGVCKDLIQYEVTGDCIGCTKCAKACPVEAIPYTPYEVHSVDTRRCVLCGLCAEECNYGAIRKVALYEHRDK